MPNPETATDMNATHLRPKPIALATAMLLASLSAATLAAPDVTAAANANAAPSTDLPAVVVTAPANRAPKASITGLGELPAWEAPAQAQTFSQDALHDAQVSRLADLTKLDASVSDAYNTVGYWDYLTVRGFQLDNAYNYRREGLPISAETRIALDNKAGVELLKGTSGIQSGVSAPGGLVNFLVKRPQSGVRNAELAFNNSGGQLASVDVGERFGERNAFGLRVNAALEKLNTPVDNTEGHRHLLAVATDWQVAPGTLLEAEIEHSWQSQASVPGLSLLGTRLPSVREFSPALNLNNQPWSTPVQLQGDTGTLRWKQALGEGWKSSVTYGEQRLKSNDRAAFPYGCTDPSLGYVYNYCSNGDFELYDYRSDHEVRVTRALLAQVDGQLRWGGVQHELRAGLMRSLFHTEIAPQAYNYVGTGNLGAPYAAFAAAPTMDDASTNRQESSTELTLQDSVRWADHWQAWLGLRHTSLRRHSVKTDGSEDTALNQSINTPWAALAYTFAPQTRAYISWGEGAEAKAAPSNGTLSNAGQVLPVLKSRQVEAGVKGQYTAQRVSAQWGINVFRIQRPQTAEVNNAIVYDGDAVHQGTEGYWQGRMGAWGLSASAMLIDATRRNSSTDSINGKAPTNVPTHAVTLSGSHTWATPLPTTLQLDVARQGQRWVNEANTIELPAWTRVDAALRTTQSLSAGRSVTWQLAVRNLLDTRAWRESPTSFGHIYLFPIERRTATVSAQLAF